MDRRAFFRAIGKLCAAVAAAKASPFLSVTDCLKPAAPASGVQGDSRFVGLPHAFTGCWGRWEHCRDQQHKEYFLEDHDPNFRFTIPIRPEKWDGTPIT